MGGVVDIEVNMEAGEVTGLLLVDSGNQFFGRNALSFSTQHDGCAMGIVSTDIGNLVASHALKAHPDISLDITQQMTQVDRTIGKGQGVCDEDFAVAQFES